MGAFAIPLAIAGLGLAASQINRGGDTTGTSQARQRTAQTSNKLGTDSRKPTANAQQTGRKAVPRGTAIPRADATSGTPAPPSLSSAKATAASDASRAAAKIRRKGASQRPGTVLTGPVTGASLTPRTLLGYA